MRQVGLIVRSHHERWDGGGYPDGLAGEADPARGADHLLLRHLERDAHRPPLPQGPLPRRRASPSSSSNAGGQFDPRVVETFIALVAPSERPQGAQSHAQIHPATTSPTRTPAGLIPSAADG